jgi:cytochrome c biogenesis protein CcmG/thiol:disulfide interchange protein DsbE
METPSQTTTAPHPRPWVAILVLIPLVAILALFGSRLVQQSPGGGGFGVNTIGLLGEPKVRAMPPIPLKTFDGEDVLLSDLRGQVVVLNFWGSWCVPCRQEAPALERVWRAMREHDVQFVGVNVWDAESDALRFIRDLGVTYVNAPDPAGKLAIELGLTGVPETYLVDREGRLVRRWVGPISEDRLAALIAELAGPKDAA